MLFSGQDAVEVERPLLIRHFFSPFSPESQTIYWPFSHLRVDSIPLGRRAKKIWPIFWKKFTLFFSQVMKRTFLDATHEGATTDGAATVVKPFQMAQTGEVSSDEIAIPADASTSTTLARQDDEAPAGSEIFGETGRGGSCAEENKALQRLVDDQNGQIGELLIRVNSWESAFSCHHVVINLLRMLLKNFQSVKQTQNPDARVSIANMYYVELDDPNPVLASVQPGSKKRKVAVSIPREKERLVESLWLGRVEEGTIPLLGKDCRVKIHKTQVYNDKPLPMLAFPDSSEWIAIKRQTPSWRHSFMCKNAPEFPGIVIDSENVASWYNSGNYARTEQTIILPGHELLDEIVAMWMGREPTPAPDATLLVDSKMVRSFVSSMTRHAQSRVHFMCVGSSKLHAFLVLTAADGMQSEVDRLPVGSARL